MSEMPIIIMGAGGRMGRALARLARRSDRCRVVGLIECADHPDLGKEKEGVALSADLESVISEGCGVIDFSAAGAPTTTAPIAAAAGAVYVVGATALNDADKKAIRAAAEKTAVVASENMSLGISLMAELVKQAAKFLSEKEWDIEIHESHHRDKKDAPSGTAFLLGRAAATGRDKKLKDIQNFDNRAARLRGTIGFSSQRGGSGAGTHLVSFLSDDESFTLTHIANRREIFASGALRACLWGRGQKAGFYTMRDVLGLD